MAVDDAGSSAIADQVVQEAKAMIDVQESVADEVDKTVLGGPLEDVATTPAPASTVPTRQAAPSLMSSSKTSFGANCAANVLGTPCLVSNSNTPGGCCSNFHSISCMTAKCGAKGVWANSNFRGVTGGCFCV